MPEEIFDEEISATKTCMSIDDRYYTLIAQNKMLGIALIGWVGCFPGGGKSLPLYLSRSL